MGVVGVAVSFWSIGQAIHDAARSEEEDAVRGDEVG